MSMWLTLQLLLGAVLWRCGRAAESQKSQTQYCIIGGGPAGIQLGHFFLHAGRDYVIFEKQATAGSFFEQYPRHRKLISLNKRKVREGRSEDFAFRHDWNTLIDVREAGKRTPPVTERSKELFPHASVLVEYLSEFAEEQNEHIRYNSSVQKIQRQGSIFELTVASPDSPSHRFLCVEVIIATGLAKPRLANLRVDGAEHVLGYEDLPSSGESFEGQAVLILGQGNAALETAQELQQYTSEVHLVSRARPLPEGGSGVRLAYQTHYVGDIRAGRTTILDTYLLKSLDTFDFDGIEAFMRFTVVPCGGRLCVWYISKEECNSVRCRQQHDIGGQNLSYMVEVATVHVNSTLHMRLRSIVEKYPEFASRLRWETEDVDMFDEENEQLTMDQLDRLGIDPSVFKMKTTKLEVSTSALRANPQLAEELSEMRQLGGHDNLRYPMDHVIRCFGWVFDTQIFDSSLPIDLVHNRKYPQITPAWELKGVPGMYAAGTLTHSLDFRKSAGGFIHGFRYTSRALFRLLEERNFNVSWPQTSWQLPVTCRALNELSDAASDCDPEIPEASDSFDVALEPLLEMLLERINGASGPYQMFEFLGDMVLFESRSTHLQLRYLEEVPLKHFHARYKNVSRLTWVFRYSDSFHGRKVLGEGRVGATRAQDAHRSNFLHPMLAFYPAGAVNATMRHWLVEDVFTQWRGLDDRVPLAKFLHRVTASMIS